MEGGKVRFAVIGCGVIGPVHAEAAQKCADARLVAVCDVIPQRARRCGELFEATPYADYRDMLDAEALDAVSVCTPHFNHAEIAAECMRRAVHVLCEKPLAVNREQMDEMIETARREGRILAGVFQHRFDPTTATIKRAVDEGLFGRVLNAGASIRCHKDAGYYGSAEWRGTWRGEGGAVLINQAIHSIDVMQWLAGPVRSVRGHWANLGGLIEAEDTAGAAVQFASGAVGTIEATSASHMSFEAGVHLFATHGSCRLRTGWPNELVLLETDGQDRAERLRQMLAECKDEQDEEGRPPAKDYYGNSHVRQVADFIGAVRDGREPFITGEDARHAVDIVLAVYESARTGRPVRP